MHMKKCHQVFNKPITAYVTSTISNGSKVSHRNREQYNEKE